MTPGPQRPHKGLSGKNQVGTSSTARSPPQRCQGGITCAPGLAPTSSLTVTGRRPLPCQSRVPESQLNQKSKQNVTNAAGGQAHLFLKDLGQGGAVRQLDEPHHVGHRPLQRVALQNQPLLLLLLRFLTGEGVRRSFHPCTDAQETPWARAGLSSSLWPLPGAPRQPTETAGL